ncbi:hypothetical protein DFH07DRAFT_780808 [Mycena maculata]|uniref:Uncharacterized protein n=1 Tax=Mycena maculata TaxID=230809 RepID=A0AAD7MTV7_9AGAR|nr:hypothetical protein DFH07DRAFT_780808 [Mycena maculata]
MAGRRVRVRTLEHLCVGVAARERVWVAAAGEPIVLGVVVAKDTSAAVLRSGEAARVGVTHLRVRAQEHHGNEAVQLEQLVRVQVWRPCRPWARRRLQRMYPDKYGWHGRQQDAGGVEGDPKMLSAGMECGKGVQLSGPADAQAIGSEGGVPSAGVNAARCAGAGAGCRYRNVGAEQGMVAGPADAQPVGGERGAALCRADVQWDVERNGVVRRGSGRGEGGGNLMGKVP